MFQRKPIRDDLYKEILARIGDGRLPAGQRINESRLSGDLGISRTPLREAMLGLEAQGFLGSDMGRGFMVPELSAGEFLEIQGMLSHLEPLALGASFPIPPARLMELQNLLSRTRRHPGQASALVELVYGWPRLLLADCPNGMLARDVLRLEGLARRYWHESVARDFDPEALLDSIQEFYELLRTDRRQEAVTFWQGHIERYGREVAGILAAGAVSP